MTPEERDVLCKATRKEIIARAAAGEISLPYPTLCLHPEECVGKLSCPRSWACSE